MKGFFTSAKRAHRVFAVLLASVSPLAISATAHAQSPANAEATANIRHERIAYDIPAQPLSSALADYARQSDLSALYAHERLAGERAPALRGIFTREQALDHLLAQSRFSGRITGSNAIALEERAHPQRASADETDRQRSTDHQTDAPSPVTARANAEELVVTGTRIRGAAPVGSNLIVVDQQSIQDSGLATTEELIRALPQNFGGGFAQHISFQNGNIGGGSGINLRGLGSDATLTLVNGRRQAAMGLRGNFTDISSIPASAIERIEVLPDSASAVYGSDAVGGVVNFVLRRELQGLELGARWGTVTDGDLREQRYTIAAGHSVGPLQLFGAYEHLDRSALAMADRTFMADSDLTRLGGSNFDLSRSNPTTLVVSGLGNFAVPTGQDGRSLTQADLLAGQINTANANEGLDALPDTTQHAAFVSASLALGPRLDLYLDARWAKRSFRSANAHVSQRITIPATNAFRTASNLFPGRTLQADYDFYRDLGARLEDGVTETIDLAAGLQWDISSWRIEPSLAYAKVTSDHMRRNLVNMPALTTALASSNPDTTFNPFGDGSFTNPTTLEAIRGFGRSFLLAETWNVGIKADGELIDLPAGAVRVALGIEHRQEFFRIYEISRTTTLAPTPSTSSKNDRDVSAAFVEFLIPVFGPELALPIGRRLDLSLAGRIEDYSDFGDTANPKIGARWELTEAFSLRASYGQSFRAPNLSDLDEAGSLARRQVRGLNIADAGAPSGRSNILLVLGANPDLREQRAESWSAGVSYTPPQSDLQMSLNYFDVRFSDRISSITNIAAALNPESEFASLIDRSPDADEVAVLLAEAAALGTSGGFSPSDITVIVDARAINLATTDVRGLDASISYDIPLAGGDLTLRADFTYLLEFLRAASPQANPADIVDTVGNPVDLRARLGASWRNERWRAALFANYTDGYRDNLSTPQRDVDAWLTFDASISLTLSAPGRPEISLSIANLFDEDPPFVNNAAGFGYDSSNADPRGRFVALELSTRF